MGRAIKHGGEGLGRPHAGKRAAARVGTIGGFRIRVLTIERIGTARTGSSEGTFGTLG